MGTKIEREEKAQALVGHSTRRTLSSLSEFMRDFSVVHSATNQPPPPPSLSLSLSLSLSPSLPIFLKFSRSVPPFFFSICAISFLWTLKPCLDFSASSLYHPFSSILSPPSPFTFSVFVPFILFLYCNFQDSSSVWAVGGGIDLTLYWSSLSLYNANVCECVSVCLCVREYVSVCALCVCSFSCTGWILLPLAD